jgi:succinylarginine dihydrolase
MSAREVQFDGIVGATHNYGGMSPGNVASTTHEGEPSNPRAAAHQGIAKMKFVRDLGVVQAVLPPHDRPSLQVLRELGFRGSDEEIIANASKDDALLLRLTSSAAAMWTANAATVAPSEDTRDHRVHFVPANLQQMFHRSIEAKTTTRILRAIFSDDARFTVHEPLPGGGQFADEGAANHTRLKTSRGAVHLYAWGRQAWNANAVDAPKNFPARQTREASEACARLHAIDIESCRFPQQHPDGIDAGAFHTDVMAVGNLGFFMLHELAFKDANALVADLKKALGDELFVIVASSTDLPAKSAVKAYPFNSQVLTLGDGTMTIIAPEDSREDDHARRFLEKVTSAPDSPVRSVHYMDVRQSMHNGGGPACLRLRVMLEEEERQAIAANIFLTDDLASQLSRWIDRHYRDRLVPKDLQDPTLVREVMAGLDDLTKILGLGSPYDFQK